MQIVCRRLTPAGFAKLSVDERADYTRSRRGSLAFVSDDRSVTLGATGTLARTRDRGAQFAPAQTSILHATPAAAANPL